MAKDDEECSLLCDHAKVEQIDLEILGEYARNDEQGGRGQFGQAAQIFDRVSSSRWLYPCSHDPNNLPLSIN